MAVMSINELYHVKLQTSLLLWMAVSSCISALNEPQTFSVREPGSLDVTGYTCNSYIKQFSSVDQVCFDFMGVIGERCLCSLNVSPSLNVIDEDTVLSIEFQGLVMSVSYISFRECSEDLTFDVSSSVTQIKLIVRCFDDYLVNDVNKGIPIVLMKYPKFRENISMHCKSENEITTAIQNALHFSTTESTTELWQKFSNKTGLIAGTVVGILLVVGVALAVILIIRYIINKKSVTSYTASTKRNVHGNQDVVKTAAESEHSVQYAGW